MNEEKSIVKILRCGKDSAKCSAQNLIENNFPLKKVLYYELKCSLFQ